MTSPASTLRPGLALVALIAIAIASGSAHAADLIVSAQDGKFVRVDGVATFPEPAPRDSLVVLDATRFPPVVKATVDGHRRPRPLEHDLVGAG